MRKFVIVFAILLTSSCVLAEDEFIQDNINMTPQKTFSGYTDNGSRTVYPRLNYQPRNYDAQRANIMKSKSIHEMHVNSNSRNINTPMKFDEFPQNYDSSNMLHTQGIQNGIRNMYMNF